MAVAAALPEEVDTSCYVYILGSFGKGGCRTYVGWTSDLDRRLLQHNSGTGARSTRGRAWTQAQRVATCPKRRCSAAASTSSGTSSPRPPISSGRG